MRYLRKKKNHNKKETRHEAPTAQHLGKLEVQVREHWGRDNSKVAGPLFPKLG